MVQVIDLISLKPFDMETISKSIKKTRNAVIVEECMKTGGIGASLSAMINESLFDELDHQACTSPSAPHAPLLLSFLSFRKDCVCLGPRSQGPPVQLLTLPLRMRVSCPRQAHAPMAHALPGCSI